MQSVLRNTTTTVLLLFIIVAKGEERLSWFTKDPDLRRSLFVPDNLPEGKEENRVLPWIFHNAKETKLMKIKCMMRGFNASNNPSDYQDARWSHPGFDDSQVDTSAPVEMGDEVGVPYAIWTMEVTTSAEDPGEKWATCEWQQGDFPLSTDLKFLIFRRLPFSLSEAQTVDLSYDLGGQLDDKDMTKQIEEDVKRQISDHYSMSASSVSRPEGGQKFIITVNKELVSDPDDGNSDLPQSEDEGERSESENYVDDPTSEYGDDVSPNSEDKDNAVDVPDIGEDVSDADDPGTEHSNAKSNASDGWSTGSIVLISLLVIALVTVLILVVIYIRPDKHFQQWRETSLQQHD